MCCASVLVASVEGQMSGCTSPAYSTSYDESQDRDAVSCSCSPSAELVTSDAHSSSDETEASEPRSAFRPIGVSPLPIHQQLLAILHSELPRPWRSALSEPCSATADLPPLNSSERGADEKQVDYLERRRKNNDSARRSREVRRQREVSNRQQVEILESENVQLRAHIALLRLEVGQLSLVLMAEGVKPAL